MRDGWNYKAFEECLDDIPRISKIKSIEYKNDGKFPIVSQEESIISGYWDNVNDVIKLSHPVIVFGDHTRVIKYIDFDFVIGADGVKIINPKQFICPKFLYYYLKWCNIPSLGYSRHYKLLKQLKIPVPPLAEQERIVAELDLLTGIIDRYKAQLRELDTLAQSLFYSMFGDPITNDKGWEILQLQNICDVRDGTHDSPQSVKTGYPLVTSKNIINDSISFDNINYISEEDYKIISKRSYVDDGDIIMPMIGTIGNPIIVRKDREFAIKNVALIKFGNSAKVNNIFVKTVISCDSFTFYMKSKNKGGTQKFISLGDIRHLKIITPPIDLQIKFADRISKIEKQKELINKAVADTQQLLKYTLDKYFG